MTTTSSSTSTTTATTSFTSGSINVSGLGNGTDFNSLIDGIITAESSTKTQLTNWKAQWQAKVEGFQYLNTQMQALQTTLSGMDTVNEFMTKTVTSTSDSALTATADSDAQEGTHSIIVAQLAQNDILTTASGVSSLTSTVTNSATSFTFNYAGTNYTVSNIGAGSTLTSLVNFINNNNTCSGKIRATTIFDGSLYHLQIFGLDQGAGNQLVLSNMGSLVFGAGSFQQTQNAQSALIKVDGFPIGTGNWISRNSNTVTDVVPGLTLNLKQASSNATIQIGVAADPDSIKQNIKTFVTQVNNVLVTIQALTKVSNSSGTAAGSLLTGNYGVEIIQTQLQDLLTGLGLGFNFYSNNGGHVTGDYYSSLAQLGISTDPEEGDSTFGQLLLDESTLDDALATNPDAVAKLFAASYEGVSESEDFSYLARVNGTTKPGSYAVSVVTSASGISSATINGVKAGIDGWRVTGLTGDAAGLVLELNNHTGNSTYTGTVDLKQGKAGQMVDTLTQLTDSTNGPLAILEDNYGDIMTDINNKIDSETQRLATMKTNLQNQYAKLDSLLNTLTNTQTQLTSTITQLSK